jgi:hypothetical protein
MALHYEQTVTARTTAIFTNAEVATTTISVNEAGGSQIAVRIDATIVGAMTLTIRGYTSQDGTTWDALLGTTGAAAACSLTATDTVMLVMPPLGGAKFFRCTVVGVDGGGGFAGTDCLVSYHYVKRGLVQ